MNWQSVISVILKIILVILALINLISGEYVWFIAILFAIVLTLLPSILAKDFNIQLPLIFDAAITVAVFFHVIGEYADFYQHVLYYDHLTHFLTSATISLIGITLLYILVFTLKVTHLPPLFFGFFAVLFTMSMGVIWEFMEWAFDAAFGTELQRGLHDTMWDFVFDTSAGIVMAAIATIQLRRSEGHRIEELTIGDIKNSIGYKRWQQLTDKDKNLKDKMQVAFKDPIVLEGMFDYIVKECKQITIAEERLWHKAKKRFHEKEERKK